VITLFSSDDSCQFVVRCFVCDSNEQLDRGFPRISRGFGVAKLTQSVTTPFNSDDSCQFVVRCFVCGSNKQLDRGFPRISRGFGVA